MAACVSLDMIAIAGCDRVPGTPAGIEAVSGPTAGTYYRVTAANHLTTRLSALK